MVEDINPNKIGVTESWANRDIADAEIGLTGYVMFMIDRIERRGGGVILYIKNIFRLTKYKTGKQIAIKLFGAIYLQAIQQ